MKLLFIVKRRNDSYGISTGLLNSARFVAEALAHVCAVVVEATDANDIDRIVTKERPDIAIIEAIWVTPSKLTELVGLHRRIKWVVRIHSKMPFLAEEGMAIEWLDGYERIHGVTVAANSLDMVNDLREIFGCCSKVEYLPNIYILPWGARYPSPVHGRTIDIGCFGAIRPLKNTLKQAVAAIQLGNVHDLRVRFHVNAGRVEMRGENVLKNLRALFAGTAHGLVEHPWLEHDAFISIVRRMDVGMQVSLTESFNIVSADMVANGIPVVASREIDWLPGSAVVNNPTNTYEIRRLLEAAISGERLEFARLQRNGLAAHNRSALSAWDRFLDQNE